MRDYILLYINGREHKIKGANAFLPLSNFLRSELGLCGTKVVCAEGDCGACSVMLGRLDRDNTKGDKKLSYVPVNSCIQFVYQLDLAHAVTVEGLKLGAALNPVQQSMVDCNGAQCGYCTPGFVVALCGAANEICPSVKPGSSVSLTEKQVKDSLTGNLCRCTGYEGIIKAGMDFDIGALQPFSTLYEEKPIIAAFDQLRAEAVLIEHDGRKVFLPASLDDATRFLKQSADQEQKVSIVAGGTDISVNINKRGLRPAVIISLCNLNGLDKIEESDDDGRTIVTVGAKVTLTRLERYFEKVVPQFHRVLWVYGSPQIRQAGTLAGNIGNGSPIADSLPFLFAVNADVELTGVSGSRIIPIQSFYTGYKKLAMEPSEIISRIIVPLPKDGEILRLYKISKRQHLDISSFTAAIVVKLKQDKIVYARVVLGGVGPVVLRLKNVEEYLIGSANKLDTYKEAGQLARQSIEPIDDVRGAREFRLQLAENIFQKFFYEMNETKEKALS